MAFDVSVKEVRLPLSLRLFQRHEFPHKLGICEYLFAKRLSENRICWVETAAGPIWKLDLANSTHRWIVYGKYEGASFFNWMERNLSPNPIIVDSGANIGQMILYFGTCFPKARILAFEPGNPQADWLCECLAVNPAIPLKLFRQALGECEGAMYLHTPGPSWSHGGQNIVAADPSGEPVQVVRLSEVLDSEKIPHVDLWKLDVEGFEIPALTGAIDWLKSKRIRALWIETIGEKGGRVMNFMRDVGYQGFALSRKGRAMAVSNYSGDNTLFLPR